MFLAVFIVTRPPPITTQRKAKMYRYNRNRRNRNRIEAKKAAPMSATRQEAENRFTPQRKPALCHGPIVLYMLEQCRPQRRMLTILIPLELVSLGTVQNICSSFAWCKKEPMLTHANGEFKIMLQIRLNDPGEDFLEFAGTVKRWAAEEFGTTAYVSSVRSQREAKLRFGDL